jgi:signal transduction histidine kinase
MIRFHRYLLIASVLVPALVFLAASAWNRSEVLREETLTIARTTAVFHEHARKVFDTVELVLGRVDDRIQRQSADEVSSAATSAFLQTLKAPLEHIVSIWVTDAEGRVLAGSQSWDPNTTIAEREFFQVHRERDAGLFISDAFVGKATATSSFAVSRRRSTPDGRFAGTIHVALSPNYFTHFFEEAAAAGPHHAALFRQDGAILARAPARVANTRVAADSPLMQMIRSKPDAGGLTAVSVVDNVRRVFAYRRVAPFGLYVSFAVDESVILARWRRNVLIYGIVAGLSALTLLVVSWLALKRARAEKQALLQLKHESEQRLAAEQRLLQSQKMESLGQLTGGIAHDFNNLLAVVLGNLDLLRKRIQDDERARRLLEGAIQGAQRGAALTQRLLAFARRQELTPQAVDIPQLVASMTDLLARSLGPSIQIVTQFPPDLAPVRVDPNQLELALLNLAVNARDAMPISGTIMITGRAEEVREGRDGLSPGSYVCVAVRDTGLGMDRETLARAVEPFFTTKGVGKGTGLGLSMIQGFAIQSGGTLRLTSKVGEGTTVELWLPQGEPAAAVHNRAGPKSFPARHCTVLLVEDDALVLAGTAAMLEDLGHVVVPATSGEAAIQILRENRSIELVVTDYAMPGMTGLELAERIRAEWSAMPILLASGHAELPERTGMNIPRLNKPFGQEELANAIADVVTPACEPANIVPLRAS